MSFAVRGNRYAFISLGIASVLMSVSLTACKGDIVHIRPMAELTQKAQALMAAGDYEGAIARLESAHDLNPAEPNTTYNLALAYQAADKPLKAIPLVTDLLDKHPAGVPKEGELKKLLGMLWEAQGDQLHKAAQAAEEGDKKPKKASSEPSEQDVEANRAYSTAIDFYSQALQSPGVTDAETLKAQIAALRSNQKPQNKL
jgi:tetratricopeptide (TPR) repeat protein